MYVGNHFGNCRLPRQIVRAADPPLNNTVSKRKFLPYNESLAEYLPSDRAVGKLKCKICDKQVQSKNMRKRVGSHILKKKLINVCGLADYLAA